MGAGSKHKKARKEKQFPVAPDGDGMKKQLEQNFGAAAAANAAAQSRPAPPGCMKKLKDPDPNHRELGCSDAATLALEPATRAQLFEHKAHEVLIQLLGDENLNVRTAASIALRNYISVAPDELVDIVVTTALLSLLDASARDLAVRITADAANPSATTVQALQSFKTALDEILQLLSVIAEASEVATQQLSSQPSFLQLVVDALTIQEVAPSAAELLNVLSSENQQTAQFLATGLTPQQQATVDSMISNVPTSPSLLRVSVNLAATLLNCMPSGESIAKILPVVQAALAHLPLQGARQVLPLLSDKCTLEEEVIKAGVDQQMDRLRCLQTAVDIAGNILSTIADTLEDEEDDETAFVRSPLAQALLQSSIPASISALARDVFPPIPDVVLLNVLRQPSINNTVAGLQRLYLAVEVGVCSLTSSLLILVPLTALGSDVGGMWTTVATALTERLRLLKQGQATEGTEGKEGLQGEDEDAAPTTDDNFMCGVSLFSTPEAQAQLIYQMESLLEILWTIQRKDTAKTVVASTGDVDLLTRLVWEKDMSVSSKVFLVNIVGCIGVKAATPEGTLICAKMCCALMERDIDAYEAVVRSGVQDDEATLAERVEVAAECANVIMDLFSDERFDASAYVPLGIQQKLQQRFLPALQQAMKGLRRKSPKRAHFSEIGSNVDAFLQYKRQNVKA